ncbi:MAG: AraC family transcriptional regulator [Candidatus Symbiothrix sp.]|nr:AraC family transcriptional regulator [Candidatus Symbiothrix sp.]
MGFNDPKYFSACFKKEFGMTPSEYLEKILAEQ